MLILTRKSGQGFRVGEDIVITITEISGDKVKVGIDAPKDIKILRSELSETMEQNVQAAHSAGSDTLRALARGLKKEPGALKVPVQAKLSSAANTGGVAPTEKPPAETADGEGDKKDG